MTTPDSWPQRAAADQLGVLLTWLQRALVDDGNAWHASDRLADVAHAADRLRQILDIADDAGEVVDWDAARRDGATTHIPQNRLAAWLARQRTTPPAHARETRRCLPRPSARCALPQPPTDRRPRGR